MAPKLTLVRDPLQTTPSLIQSHLTDSQAVVKIAAVLMQYGGLASDAAMEEATACYLKATSKEMVVLSIYYAAEEVWRDRTGDIDGLRAFVNQSMDTRVKLLTDVATVQRAAHRFLVAGTSSDRARAKVHSKRHYDELDEGQTRTLLQKADAHMGGNSEPA